MEKSKFDVSSHFTKIDVLDKGHVELVDGMFCDPLLKIVNSARVSYAKESRELTDADKKLVKYLSEHGHLSTFRHSYFSFRIKAPLFVFRQWWKYQVGSDWVNADELGSSVQIPDTGWNEVSGRYVEFKPEFYVPEKFYGQSKSSKQGTSDDVIEFVSGEKEDEHGPSTRDVYERGIQESYRAYDRLVRAGVAKEIARGVLPAAVYTECIWTCSIQTLIHFLTQRLDGHAQREIRQYAIAVRAICSPMLDIVLPES